MILCITFKYSLITFYLEESAFFNWKVCGHPKLDQSGLQGGLMRSRYQSHSKQEQVVKNIQHLSCILPAYGPPLENNLMPISEIIIGSDSFLHSFQ